MCSVDLWEVPAVLRNPHCTKHLHERLDLLFSGKLRVSNFGLFSIAWRDDKTSLCCQYSESCPYSLPSNGGDGEITSLFRLFLFDRPTEQGLPRVLNIARDRILDYGLFGHWVCLQRSMEDYDVNPYEWAGADPVATTLTVEPA